ncbi:RapZ C-terminal domain-containing protein [Streptomyces klenkii]
MSDDFHSVYGKIFQLQRLSDELLMKTRARATYDALRTEADACAEYNDEKGLAAATRELEKYGDEIPPHVTTEEFLDYHQIKAAMLRTLVREGDEDGLVDALAEAEEQLAAILRTADVRIVSFGYGHHNDRAPEELGAHITLDLRAHFRDPHVHPDLVTLTGLDLPVHRLVMDTDGIRDLLDATAAAVRAFRAGPSAGPVTVAVGCVGGRHRSVAFAVSLSTWLRDEAEAPTLVVEHMDIERPVIDRPAQS